MTHSEIIKSLDRLILDVRMHSIECDNMYRIKEHVVTSLKTLSVSSGVMNSICQIKFEESNNYLASYNSSVKLYDNAANQKNCLAINKIIDILENLRKQHQCILEDEAKQQSIIEQKRNIDLQQKSFEEQKKSNLLQKKAYVCSIVATIISLIALIVAMCK